MRWLRPFAVTALCASLAACSTSPTGRSQLLLLSDDQLNQMGQQAFAQYQRDVPTANQASHRYVQCITNAIVEDRLNEADCEPGFLLDGYPRTLAQVEALDALLSDNDQSLDAVLELVVDDEELIKRLLKRAETSGRTDDTEEVIRERQAIYVRETAPLAENYRERGLLVGVDGEGDMDEVTERIEQALAKAAAN